MQPSARFASLRSGYYAQDLKAIGFGTVPIIEAVVTEVATTLDRSVYEARLNGLTIRFETLEPIDLRGRNQTGVVLEVRPAPQSRKMSVHDREYFIVAVNAKAGYIGLLDTTDA